MAATFIQYGEAPGPFLTEQAATRPRRGCGRTEVKTARGWSLLRFCPVTGARYIVTGGRPVRVTITD